MPLNRLDNIIKNTEGRILYVSPSDLDSTDSIDNTGNSLARPFKTLQRALIESARFSYIRGNSNDEVEKTTILLMPGEHIVDNRPGYKIRTNNTTTLSETISPSGLVGSATANLNLDLESNFDLTQRDNILSRFNSVEGGVIVPRGTSIVGLDLRKTKIRPKYVPNPTDPNVANSSIFKITGTCYFWQFSIFDGNEIGLVYTDPTDFSESNQSKPIFSHHKLTCFEYADGVNKIPGYDLTDLDMYYAKLSNAYNTGSGSPNRNIEEKYPESVEGFSKQRPEWEIVGAFADDPITITSIESGEGGVASNTVTVTTEVEHNLNVGTPVKIRGVIPNDYNISTKVQSVDIVNPRKFTYLLPTYRQNLPTPGNPSSGSVTIETDTVSGASPYIFNISLRSIYGMNGMHADGSKASGFRSMVVAQFTGVSLQKDDRAFVKYNKSTGTYSSIPIEKVIGSDLSNASSSTNQSQTYHLDSDALYRKGWEQTHVKVSNDAIVQIVSVFAIGYNKHFVCESGGDASITNSNSNFGQISLVSDGFRKDAFEKDNNAFITNIIPPRRNVSIEENIDWLSIDIDETNAAGDNTRLYLKGFLKKDDVPPILTQGYRIGAKINDKLFLNIGGNEYEANILMENGVDSSYREFSATALETNKLEIGIGHGIQTGEKVIIISDDGNYPENITPHLVYYAISFAGDPINSGNIELAQTKTDADNGNKILIYGGTNLRILSRVTDRSSGEYGHPVQFDETRNRWYINVNSGNTISSTLSGLSAEQILEETESSYIKRISDTRSLDEKIYKFRVVVPKELRNAKTPEAGFIIQESSTTGFRNFNDSVLNSISISDYNFKKNPRIIANCSQISSTTKIRSELPHNLEIGDKVRIKNVIDTNNTDAEDNLGYNGTFIVSNVPNNMEFEYTNNQLPGTFQNDITIRNENLPRFERSDLKSNFYIYRNEVIQEYIDSEQDGVYHIYALNSDNQITQEFTDLKYSQNVTDLYPQLDRDNLINEPKSARSYATSSPLGIVNTSDRKSSITKETADKLITKLHQSLIVNTASPITGGQQVTFSKNHSFNGIVSGTLTVGSSGRNVDGTYYNVRLYNENTLITWDGATATVVLLSGSIDSFEINSPGCGYNTGDILYFDTSSIGGNADAFITIGLSDIVSAVGDVIQITGQTEYYYRITEVSNTNSISIASTSGDPTISQGDYMFHVGRSTQINSSSFNSGISTITCSDSHGLFPGNQIKVIDNNNNDLGNFIINEKTATTLTFESENSLVNSEYVLPHFLSSNEGISDVSEENISKRTKIFYGKDVLKIDNGGNSIGITTNIIPVEHPDFPSATGEQIAQRFPIGSYIQVNSEIMRVSSSSLLGSNQLLVIRGVLGSKVTEHEDQSVIYKTNPLPVEFRRPSIIRASGHTFEYLGYGPGNYSTGLPQVQIKTLTEQEEYLSQAQERSSGVVVYTGMNNRGDFYIGNIKKSSTTGEESTYDVPIPTITGQDPSRFSAIFDEIIVKERILVEGGDSNQILSQFDGPVTLNNTVRIKDSLSISGPTKIKNETQSTNKNSGSLIVDGGVGIKKNLNVGENLTVTGNATFASGTEIGGHTTITGDTTITGSLSVTGNTTLGNQSTDTTTITGDTTITGALDVTGDTTITGVLDVNGNTTLGNQSTDTTTITGVLDVNGSADIDNVRINGNTITTTNTNGNLNLGANGTGVVRVDDSLTVTGNATINGNTTLGNESGETFDTTTINGVLDVNGPADIDDVRIEFDTITTTNTNGNLNLSANGNGVFVDDSLTVTGSISVNNDNILLGTDDGNIELLRSNGAYIDFKRNNTQDFDARITNTTSGAITIVGNLKVGNDITLNSSTGGVNAQNLNAPNIAPIGSIIAWPGVINSWPTTNWRECNGQSLSRTTYADLFAILGTRYGIGDGSTTFNLPNLTSRFIGGVGLSPLNSLGNTGGNNNAVLVAHNHGINDPGHAHQYTDTVANLSNNRYGSEAERLLNSNQSVARNTTFNGTGISIQTKGLNSSGGPNDGQTGTNANLPPYMALYWIIRIR